MTRDILREDGRKNALPLSRQHRFTPPPPPSVWLISFTDVIALMLTFFVLMFSMATPEKTIMDSLSFSLKEQNSYQGSTAPSERNQDPATRLQARAGKDLTYLAAILKNNFAKDEDLQDVKVTLSGEVLKITLPHSLLFASGAYRVRSDVAAPLQNVFRALSGLNNQIDVYGYTDAIPVTRERAEYQSNWGLSQQRAAAVAGLLYQSGYILPLGVYGKGAEQNASKASTEARRVEIIVRGAQ